jgi:AraC-like DNA-binding protein
MLRKASKKPYSRYVMVAIETIKQHIDQNPLQYRTSAELLDYLNTPNRTIVEKAFKDTYGAGIKGYQVRQRLEESKKFLELGITKKQVAAKCFYKDQASFCRAFKHEFKITPTEWQNMFE